MANSPLIACACCGYQSITEEHDICPLCFWQSDWVQEKHYPDWNIGANGNVSLREAQHNFIEYGACERAHIDSVRRPNSADIHDSDWKSLTPLAEGEEPLTPSTELKKNGKYCACCGYKTIIGKNAICFVCGWIQDDAQESDPDSTNGANHRLTFRIAQGNYKMLGAVSEDHKVMTAEPKSENHRNPNWKPLD